MPHGILLDITSLMSISKCMINFNLGLTYFLSFSSANCKNRKKLTIVISLAKIKINLHWWKWILID